MRGMVNSKFLLIAVLCALSGCATSAPKMYLSALDARYSGDSDAYEKQLLKLVQKHPDSREGRKARAVLASSPMGGTLTSVYLVGVAAAVAIPNFLKFQSRARQSEAKINLSAVAIQSQILFREVGAKGFVKAELQWSPAPDAKYIYIMNSDLALGNTSLEFEARDALQAAGVAPGRKSDGSFLVAAVGNIDGDTTLDIWTIDHNNERLHLMDDVED